MRTCFFHMPTPPFLRPCGQTQQFNSSLPCCSLFALHEDQTEPKSPVWRSFKRNQNAPPVLSQSPCLPHGGLAVQHQQVTVLCSLMWIAEYSKSNTSGSHRGPTEVPLLYCSRLRCRPNHWLLPAPRTSHPAPPHPTPPRLSLFRSHSLPHSFVGGDSSHQEVVERL